MPRRLLRLFPSFVVLLAMLGMTACSGKPEPDAARNLTMKPSVTYLHLLRHTPFFTALSTEQLQWTIDHSREWEAQAGAVIATCDEAVDTDAPYWILLDGGWRVEARDRAFPAGHADPGKWFSATVANGASCRLVTTETSYVMRIERQEMQQMLARGFGFGAHLEAGEAYYRRLFAGG
ncbi:hypothetical protein [Burkholderia gladioli]|uniref:hypothetical protein n=1 Tax=Burkholderia gladioli TaxID=28095 RepID=UPI00163E4E6A|nr:hypothetical protein [Burkholderia gladioli]